MDFPRVDDYKIRVWSEKDVDYIFSCAEPKGSLYEVKLDKDPTGNTMSEYFGERRVFSNDATEQLCKRLFSDL